MALTTLGLVICGLIGFTLSNAYSESGHDGLPQVFFGLGFLATLFGCILAWFWLRMSKQSVCASAEALPHQRADSMFIAILVFVLSVSVVMAIIS